MGKVSPRDRESKTRKQRRHIRSSSNKHLKPDALAQLRHIKASAANSCKDLGMESIGQLNAIKGESVTMLDDKVVHGSSMFPPKTFESLVDCVDLPKQHNLFKTPKTSDTADCTSESRLESLPIDLLVEILCHLHHDQLRAVFHVSRRIRMAVLIARQYYFNFITPDRSRQKMFRTTLLSTEHVPFLCDEDENAVLIPTPNTPSAPRHGPRPTIRVNFTNMPRLIAVLRQESTSFSKYMVPSIL